ncbi:AAA family ATPase [Streptomyces sp. PSKA54]|uniref:AAA family ATPase n=1 Tax=Streptomyces himalayensis subsp. aureolus TaxID=2758039 RepID=A0A7W2D112_9ACTN|nr:AAA family ATPase [Streptomyces himalayensis]MBA4862716.1 AAA family ATPase [Streptomyces himalayensis subsp. aureolus]
MTVHRTSAYATTTGVALPEQPAATVAKNRGRLPEAVVRDLRDRAGRGPRRLSFAEGDVVVVSGLPGSGKSTLMRRAVAGARIDSQDTRDRWDGKVSRRLPYAVYRPFVRLAHYAGLRRALRSGASVVVHDCGTQAWVRRWLSREARRRGGTLHLLVLDVTPDTALAGQRERGRGVSRYAFARHRRAVTRLIRSVERGELPPGCSSAVLLDRSAADLLRAVDFDR